MTEYFFGTPATRNLSNTKVVPYSPSTAFAALSDVSSYERATSLIYGSSVTSKDANGLPKTAKLSVGYPALALNEEWLCRVKCDKSKRTIELSPASSPEFQSYAVESYNMKWSISSVPNDKSQAEIKLDLEVKLKGPMVDSMFAVLPDVAGRFMYRFSALVEAMEKKEKEQAKKKPVPAKKAVPAPTTKAPAAKKPAPVVKTPEVAAASAKKVPKKLEVRAGQVGGGKQPAAS